MSDDTGNILDEKAANPSVPSKPEAVEALLARLEGRKGRRFARFWKYVLLVAVWAGVPFSIVMFLLSLYAGKLALQLDAAGYVMVALLLRYLARGQKRMTSVYATLAQYDDTRAIAPLIHALDWPDRRTKASVIVSLTRLLPRLKASEVALLPHAERMRLCRLLNKNSVNKTPELVLAILKAFEQVGDAKVLPHVQNLAYSEPKSVRAKRIREAAEHCLPYLLERVEQQKAGATLLRAASPADAPPELLLRPAVSVPDPEPQRLLRSASSPKMP